MIIVYNRSLNRVCQVRNNYRNRNRFLIVIVSFDIQFSHLNFVNILFFIFRDYHRSNLRVYIFTICCQPTWLQSSLNVVFAQAMRQKL